MEQSYSNSLIKFGLRHFIDISSGNPPLQKAADEGFIKSAGRKNPQETFLIWIADISQAIASLSKDDLWPNMVRDVGFEIMRASLHKLPLIQRHVVRNCIFGECYWCQSMLSCPKEKDGEYCDESKTISRMRRFLNGEEYEPNEKTKEARLRLSKAVDNILELLPVKK